MASFDYDVVIIGSGFGGSVAALRAAEKGNRVGVRAWRSAWCTRGAVVIAQPQSSVHPPQNSERGTRNLPQSSVLSTRTYSISILSNASSRFSISVSPASAFSGANW